MTIERLATRTAFVFLLLVALPGIYLTYLNLSGNFHEVLPGRFYRSAQLSGHQLERIIATYQIKTVINLRGANANAGWYQDEIRATARQGATHIDFGMSARKILSPEKSMALIALMRNVQGPILVHCAGGADRTGLASVMYLQQIAGVDEETAEWQLTPLFGHLNIPFTAAYAMDDSWEQFEKLADLPS
jgi:protein tyrosine/serine phosphatase